MKDYLKEFEETLDRIVRPVLNDDDFDDMDLATHGAELDQEPEMGKGYDQDSMVDQLEKVAQSEGDDAIKNPQRTVVTDDGKEHMVLPAQATTLGILARTDKVKPNIRAQFQKDIQTSAGLEYFLSDPEGHNFVKSQQIVQRFQEKYLGR